MILLLLKAMKTFRKKKELVHQQPWVWQRLSHFIPQQNGLRRLTAQWIVMQQSLFHPIQTTITLQPNQQYMNPTLIPHLMFSHPLPSNPITMVMSPTGLSHISFLNLQSLGEQEEMHAHLLPFYLAKCFFHLMSTSQQLGVHEARHGSIR